MNSIYRSSERSRARGASRLVAHVTTKAMLAKIK
jgi:hypothetical protein